MKQFHKLNFDTRKIDKQIAKLADYIYKHSSSRFKHQGKNYHTIAYIATELYSVGGHTPCIINLAECMNVKGNNQALYLTQLTRTEAAIPSIIESFRNTVDEVAGVNISTRNIVENVITLYNLITSFSPKNLVIFIHQYDILASMVLHLLRKYTDIKLIFWNHASHFPNVGMHFAHLILEGTPTTLQITQQRRHLHNCKIIGLQSKAVDQTQYYTDKQKLAKRKELGILDSNFFTVSGGFSRKFFDSDSKSEYFQMILRLLNAEPRLKHLVLSDLNTNEIMTIESIFEGHQEERTRLLLQNRTTEYELIFQCADLYIDSLPIGSAMTQIDCMRNKVLTIVYINKNAPEHTFHEYMPPDYPYMYDNVQAMEKAILSMLENREAKQIAVNMNYNHWLANYERSAVTQKYLDIFNQLNNEH